ncbi:MAG TPA: multiheme c-type cytochrome [Rhodocyclaceae bacterium]|nr:multiheme c-type cytochrome [Rhodocyclaceae bacterium]
MRLFALLLAVLALPSIAAPPGRATDPAYVDDARCARCHPGAARAWKGSHHARSMQKASPATVLGGFDGTELREGNETVRLHRDGKRFYAQARDREGRLRNHRILYTFGVEPLQQYLVAAPGGRLQALTAAWDTRARRWFSLDDAGARPGDAFHWTGRYRNWNLMCAECHSTGVRKGYEPDADGYRTTWAALNVGCQACHGPGRPHLEAARQGRRVPMPVTYAAGDPARETDQCARCHSVRSRLTERDDPTAPFLDRYRPETLRPGLYHADGQQDGEVFEAGSFRQSRMHAAGVRCSDCHDPHGGKLRRPGDATCTACHSPAGDARFPSAGGRSYDGTDHHFHASGKAGSRCVDCHMPSRNYMVVHPRRDHAIRIPRPDLSARTGAPDACTACHADRTPAWSAAVLEERRKASGTAAPGPHYGELFAAARRGARGALPHLANLARDRAYPAILRATAAEALGDLGADVPEAVFSDPDGQVRAAAAGAARARNADALLPLLADPLRAVRIAAARTLATDAKGIAEERRGAYFRALAEYRAAQASMADAPAARLNLGMLEEDLGRAEAAEAQYRAALAMDRHFTAARLALAEILAARGAFAEAKGILRAGLGLGQEDSVVREALVSLAGRERAQGRSTPLAPPPGTH